MLSGSVNAYRESPVFLGTKESEWSGWSCLDEKRYEKIMFTMWLPNSLMKPSLVTSSPASNRHAPHRPGRLGKDPHQTIDLEVHQRHERMIESPKSGKRSQRDLRKPWEKKSGPPEKRIKREKPREVRELRSHLLTVNLLPIWQNPVRPIESKAMPKKDETRRKKSDIPESSLLPVHPHPNQPINRRPRNAWSRRLEHQHLNGKPPSVPKIYWRTLRQHARYIPSLRKNLRPYNGFNDPRVLSNVETLTSAGLQMPCIGAIILVVSLIAQTADLRARHVTTILLITPPNLENKSCPTASDPEIPLLTSANLLTM